MITASPTLETGAAAGLDAGSGQLDQDVRRSVRRLRRAALLLALAVALVMPGLRSWFGAQSVEALLRAETIAIADHLSGRASLNPEGWQYEVNAMRRMIDEVIRRGSLQGAQVLDKNGRVLDTLGRWDPQAAFVHREPVLDSGLAVGELVTQQGAGSLVQTVLQSALMSLLLAFALYLLVARVAVRSIERSIGALQHARREAVQAGAARTVFLATMSHEIRTPMNGVIGMTSLLRDTPLTERQRHFVDVIRGSGESLLRVINDILEFTKVESGRIQLEDHVFAPDALAEEVLALLEPLSRHKELKLRFEADPAVPAWVRADVNRLRQILVNLVGNAIKFSEDGEVLVRAFAAGEGRLGYEVRDAGIGMTAEQAGRIFDPFVQADASTSRRFGGTGLGLAISRRLAQQLGGDITVTSQPGVGSRFSFTVRAPASAPPDAGPLPPHSDVLQGKRVLIVDDRPVNVEIVETMVKGFGMQAVSLTDPALALVSVGAQASLVDVAVLDFNMPGLDGHALGARLRSIRADLPLVLLSSKNGAIHDPGLFDARLNKPVLRAQLRDTLRSVLTRTPVAAPDPLSLAAVNGLRADLGAPALGGLRVLVAEDDAVNTIVVGAMLERMGIVGDIVSNGAEALEAVRRQTYDVVLMDMRMPVVDGLEATRRIRARKDLVQPWIVALTANAMSEDRAACFDAGMDAFLTKPLQWPELQAALETAAQRLAETRGAGDAAAAGRARPDPGCAHAAMATCSRAT